jgi:hypothetical protein
MVSDFDLPYNCGTSARIDSSIDKLFEEIHKRKHTIDEYKEVKSAISTLVGFMKDFVERLFKPMVADKKATTITVRRRATKVLTKDSSVFKSDPMVGKVVLPRRIVPKRPFR